MVFKTMRLFVTTKGLRVEREEIQGLSIMASEKRGAQAKEGGNSEKRGQPRWGIQEAKGRQGVKEKGTGSCVNALRGRVR